ncbi:hypothetical protein B0H11DRAFT_1997359 [Mycena galericulata]|nr:hypothetical protein B0H11DRAFT_1997359 [Mycena galericulata]
MPASILRFLVLQIHPCLTFKTIRIASREMGLHPKAPLDRKKIICRQRIHLLIRCLRSAYYLKTFSTLKILAFCITHITSASFVRLGVVCALTCRETDSVRALEAILRNDDARLVYAAIALRYLLGAKDAPVIA